MKGITLHGTPEGWRKMPVKTGTVRLHRTTPGRLWFQTLIVEEGREHVFLPDGSAVVKGLGGVTTLIPGPKYGGGEVTPVTTPAGMVVVNTTTTPGSARTLLNARGWGGYILDPLTATATPFGCPPIRWAAELRPDQFIVVDPGGYYAYRVDVTFPINPRRVQGDVGGNGRFDLSDALLALYLLHGDINANPGQKQAADVDGDGFVTLEDVIRMLYAATGTPFSSPLW